MACALAEVCMYTGTCTYDNVTERANLIYGIMTFS